MLLKLKCIFKKSQRASLHSSLHFNETPHRWGLMSEVSATKICRISNSKPLCRVKFLALYHKSVCLYFELNILSMCIFFMNPYLNLVSLFSNQLSFQTHQIQTKAPLFLKSSSRLIVYFNLTVEAEPLIVAVAV